MRDCPQQAGDEEAEAGDLAAVFPFTADTEGTLALIIDIQYICNTKMFLLNIVIL